MLKQITNPFIDWLFPSRCCVCDLDTHSQNLCSVCQNGCHHNSNQTFYTDKEYSFLFFFESTMRTLIKNAKYKKDLFSCHVLLKMVEEEMEQSKLYEELARFSPDAVTYVPMHLVHRIQRGMDLPFLFAALWAKKLSIPLITLLRRKGYNNRQVLRIRKKDRLREIEGSFILAKSNASFKRLLIVDDVVTTGATFKEVLKVTRVIAHEARLVAIAKTP